MRFFLPLLLLLSINCQAQFKTVYPDRTTYFKYPATSYGALGMIANTGEYIPIKIERTKLKGEDTLYSNYRTFGGFGAPEQCYVTNKAYTWTGKEILMLKDQREVFINNENDSVIFHKYANLNDSWIFYSKGDTYFEATLIKKEIESIAIHDAALEDSVMTIAIYLKKKNDHTIVSHPFNGKKWMISKSLGFVKAYDLLNFPNDTNALNIAGVDQLNLGVDNLTENKIYDFEVGDEFHIREYNFGGSNHKKIKQEVLEKSLNTEGDSIIYKIAVEENIGNIYVQGAPLTAKQDTIYLKIAINPDLTGINEIPGKPYNGSYDEESKSFYNYQFWRNASPSVMVKAVEMLSGYYSANDSCYGRVLSDFVPYFEQNYEYWQGLGGPYYRKIVSQVMYPVGRELVYYKKDSGEWGTPLNFVLNVYPNAINSAVNVSPNPATDRIRISSDGIQNTTYKVYNIEGREVLQGTFSSAEETIDINNLKTGIYSLLISKERGIIYTTRFVKN